MHIASVHITSPMRLLLTILITALTLYWTGYSRHTLQANDCYSAKTVHRLQRREVCKTINEATPEPTNYVVLQVKKTNTVVGYRCSIHRSQFPAKCGAWSHIKLSTTPLICHRETVSIPMCQEMIKTRRFQWSINTKTHDIEIGKENYLHEVTVGDLNEDSDSVVCRGQSTRVRGKLHTNVVVLSEYHVLVEKTRFTAQGNTIEATDLHIQLPCSTDQAGCETEVGTFIWTKPPEGCALQKIKHIKTQTYMDTYQVDQQEKLIFNITGHTKLFGCDELILHTTQYSGIYLSEPSTANHLDHVKANEVEIALEIRMTAEYLSFYTETLTDNLEQGIKEELCTNRYHKPTTDDGPVRTKGDHFALVRGDVIYSFHCPVITVELLETKACFQDIPLKKPPNMFVDPVTRVTKRASNPATCNVHFPITILTTDENQYETWIELPTMKTVQEPQKDHIIGNHRGLHVTWTRGGLYTNQELQSWESLLRFPEYKKALLHTLSLGSCIHASQCSTTEGQDSYDLSTLIPMIKPGTTYNPLAQIREWIRQEGDLLAFFVILIVIGKLIIDITLIAIIILQEGLSVGAIYIMQIYLHNVTTFKKMKKRNKIRKTRRQNQSSDTDGNRTAEQVTQQQHQGFLRTLALETRASSQSDTDL